MSNITTFNSAYSTGLQTEVRRQTDGTGEGGLDAVGRFDDLISQTLRSNRSPGRGGIRGLGNNQAIELKKDPIPESSGSVREKDESKDDSEDDSKHDSEDRAESASHTAAEDRPAPANEPEKTTVRPKEVADSHDDPEDTTTSEDSDNSKDSDDAASDQTDQTPTPPPGAAALLSQLQRLGSGIQTAVATGGDAGEAGSQAPPLLLQAEFAAMEGGTSGGKNGGTTASPTSTAGIPAPSTPGSPAAPDASGSFLVSAEILRIWTGPGSDNAIDGTSNGDPATAQGQQSLASSATHRIARFFCEAREQKASSEAPATGTSNQNGAVQAAASSTGGDTSGQTPPASTPIVAHAAARDTSAASTPSQASADLSTSGQPTGETATNQNIDRIVQVLRSHVGRHDSQIRLRLDPPHLGQIQIDVTMRDDTLLLDVRTETALGKELLSSRMQDLRDALSKHGIVVERATVQMRQEVADSAPSREQQQTPSHQNSNSNQDAPGHTPDQPQHRYHGGQAVPGEDGSVPAWSADSSQPTGETRSEADVALTATESLVDTVA